MQIYLAGPEVFHRRAVEIGRAKCAICEKYGHQGRYPLPLDVSPGEHAPTSPPTSQAIFDRLVAMFDACDALIANLSPYHGIDADPGTAWEVGFAFSRGLKLMAYSNDSRDLVGRDQALRRLDASDPGVAPLFPQDETTPEDFGGVTNLMMLQSVRAAGGDVLTGRSAPFEDLALFEACVERLNESG